LPKNPTTVAPLTSRYILHNWVQSPHHCYIQTGKEIIANSACHLQQDSILGEMMLNVTSRHLSDIDKD